MFGKAHPGAVVGEQQIDVLGSQGDVGELEVEFEVEPVDASGFEFDVELGGHLAQVAEGGEFAVEFDADPFGSLLEPGEELVRK